MGLTQLKEMLSLKSAQGSQAKVLVCRIISWTAIICIVDCGKHLAKLMGADSLAGGAIPLH